MAIRFLTPAAMALALSGVPACAALAISGSATVNVTCSDGVCTATAKKANLSITDLQTMLASGNVDIVAASKAKDIEVKTSFGWSSANRLTLDSFGGIAVHAPVMVLGAGGLTLTTNDGGSGGLLQFVGKGAISFLDTTSDLTINGAAYVLTADFVTLSSDIAKNPGGNFAWARSYDAGPDGVYTQNPVTSILAGRFEGLGNTIKNLSIDNTDRGVHVGMFYEVGAAADIHLVKAHIKAKGTNVSIGALAGACGGIAGVTVSGSVTGAPGSFVGGVCGVLSGDMSGTSSSATVTGKGNAASAQNGLGGLIGFLDGGTVSNSFSSAKVVGSVGWTAGGLIGETENSTYRITNTFATGVVFVGDEGTAGGLVGNNAGLHAIDNSYATGFVGGGVNSSVGGLIGINNGPVSDSYSSGAVASGSGNAVGGFIGVDLGAADLTDTYWDTETSGQSHGVGNNTAYPGITGLTTEQFQAGLPSGFDPAIWAEDPNINGGLPYLLTIPPK
jgi:hypothetical protein